jgi:GNAT superfamily N-acetyltransferase
MVTVSTQQQLPHLTNELIRRLDGLDVLHTEHRMRGIQQQQGNPWGIAVATFGRATALMAQGLPNPFFNRVVGIGVDEVPLLDELIAFCHANSPNFSFEFLPNDLTEEIADRLVREGFRQSRFHAGFYGFADPELVLRAGQTANINVKQISTPEEYETFINVNFEGFELPKSIRAAAMANMHHWRYLSDWYLYVGELEGTPAAAAVLQVKGNTAYLASAATLPPYRRRGLQQALLRQRIADAHALGCQLVCSQAEFDSVSHHNLEKVGLQLAYTKAIWTAGGASSEASSGSQ